MGVNSDKPERWLEDIASSVDFYNAWFTEFAPETYRKKRVEATRAVELALKATANLTAITPHVLRATPSILPALRMATVPPIARDRLTGLSEASRGLLEKMEEKNTVPQKVTDLELEKIARVIVTLADNYLFPWLDSGNEPTNEEVGRAVTVVADRLSGALSDPVIRNAQEERQLASIRTWLERRGYSFSPQGSHLKWESMEPASFRFHVIIVAAIGGGEKQVRIPVDVAIMPQKFDGGQMPLLIEAKSAGDFTNPNKRQKEEGTKARQLVTTYGQQLRYILFLGGYFGRRYLEYEAEGGMDWVWEHRIDDLAEFGI